MNIMVVDDILIIRKMVSRGAEVLGLKVFEAKDGYEALSLLDKTSEQINLIFLDWNMPNMDGFEFLTRIKADKSYKNIPVVMTTTVSERENIIKAIKAGAAHYLVKPFTQEAITRKILEHTNITQFIKNIFFTAVREQLEKVTGLHVTEVSATKIIMEEEDEVFVQALLYGEEKALLFCSMSRVKAVHFTGITTGQQGDITDESLLMGLAKFFQQILEKTLSYLQVANYSLVLHFYGFSGKQYSWLKEDLLSFSTQKFTAGEMEMRASVCHL